MLTWRFASCDLTLCSRTLMLPSVLLPGMLQTKFSAFVAGVRTNPRILMSLQRRRFTLVTVLEKGTPGPPPLEHHSSGKFHSSKRDKPSSAAGSGGGKSLGRSARVAPCSDKSVAMTPTAKAVEQAELARLDKDEELHRAVTKIQTVFRGRRV